MAFSRSRLTAGLLAAISILLRCAYFTELNGGPGMVAHRWTESDMNFFDQWARVMADGDWLANRELHPYFRWQATAAQIHFQAHGEQGDGRALWNRWLHGKEYHQEPLYPYLVAVTYK